MVLVASLTIPVNAHTPQAHYLKDNISHISYDDNIETVFYKFGVDPYISALDRLSGLTYTGYNEVALTPHTNGDTIIYRVYPLGVANIPGSDIDGGVVDISDLKSKAVFSVTGDLAFEVSYTAQPYAAGDTYLSFVTYVYFCYYAADGSYLYEQTAGPYTEECTIENLGNVITGHLEFPLNITATLGISDDAVYMMPCFITYFYTPEDEAPHMIDRCTAACRTFTMTVDKNLLVEQSETLKAIDEKLDDIVDGTPEIDDAVDNMEEDVQQQGGEMDLIEKAERDYLDAWEDTNEKFNNDILNFLKGRGWVQLGLLMAPLLTWDHNITIMLMVVAFVNLSVILFGR